MYVDVRFPPGDLVAGLEQQLAAAGDSPVRALVVLGDQVDVRTLDADLQATRAPLAHRHEKVIRALQETDIQIVWYVRGDAEEGRDYDKDALTWLWHVTSLDDERIIRHNQEGVNSHHFIPGPLSEMEWSIPGFYRNYFSMI